MNTDTPRTDSMIEQWRTQINYPDNAVPGNYARNLEIELNAAKSEIKQIHKDLGYELRDPNGTIWTEAAKIQKQRDDLADALREIIIEEEFRDQIYGFTARTAMSALTKLREETL